MLLKKLESVSLAMHHNAGWDSQRAKGNGQVWETHSRTMHSDNWRNFRARTNLRSVQRSVVDDLLQSFPLLTRCGSVLLTVSLAMHNAFA